MVNKKKFYCALGMIAVLSGMPLLAVSLQPILTSVKECSKKHPLATAAVTTLALYWSYYFYKHWGAKTKQAQVDLINYGLPMPAKDHENFLFAHGIAETHKQAEWYMPGTALSLASIMNGRVFSYDYPDTTSHFWRVNFTQTSLGQSNETSSLRSAYDQAITQLAPAEKLILYGMSRGAVSIINFMGMYKPTQVKALILESPFDSTRTVAQNMINKIGLDTWPRMITTAAHTAMSMIFWQHCTDGLMAIDYAADIDKDLPILIIASAEDQRVPLESSCALYNKLIETGHTCVHFFVVDHGLHGKILKDPSSAEQYQSVVHAFYKKYGMAYDNALAERGEALLEHNRRMS